MDEDSGTQQVCTETSLTALKKAKWPGFDPSVLLACMLASVMGIVFIAQHREIVNNLKFHVQSQIDEVATLNATQPLTPKAMWNSVKGFSEVSETTITAPSGEVLGHFINQQAHKVWPLLPIDWQYTSIRSNASDLNRENVSIEVRLSLRKINASLIIFLIGIGAFSGLLIYNGLRSSKKSTSQARAIQGEMDHLSHIDPLTGLMNRTSLEAALVAARGRFQRDGRPFALLLANVDNFKMANDSWGYQVGDQILIKIASRLKSNLRANDFLARMGADEFAIVLDNFDDESDLASVAQKIIAHISEPMDAGANPACCSFIAGISIGIAKSSSQNIEIDALKTHAEAALFRAKKNGKSTFHIFCNDLAQDLHERITLRSMMRTAIENKEFYMVYQPILNLHTWRVTSFEALARWRHPVRGVIMPGVFMPIAEETGMITDIGEIALQETCNDFKWLGMQMNTEALSAAVNLSIHQFKRLNSAERLHEIVAKSGISKDKIEFEVTESTMMETVESSMQDLDRLIKLGFSLSIDDFGTGYSSLARLKEVNVKKLKIDRSFITKIENDEANQAIVKAVIQMAHSLGMRVVAEGVETLQEAFIVKSLGCDELQGYLMSRPVPIDQILKLLTAYTVTEENYQISPLHIFSQEELTPLGAVNGSV